MHYIAHLPAVAEGLALEARAVRYLGCDTPGAARRAHRLAVERLRAVARRWGDPRWRLVGRLVAPPTGEPRPMLEDWAAQQGLQDCSHSEQRARHEPRI